MYKKRTILILRFISFFITDGSSKFKKKLEESKKKHLQALVEENKKEELNSLVNTRGVDVTTTCNFTLKNFQFVNISPLLAATLLDIKDAIQCFANAKN